MSIVEGTEMIGHLTSAIVALTKAVDALERGDGVAVGVAKLKVTTEMEALVETMRTALQTRQGTKDGS